MNRLTGWAATSLLIIGCSNDSQTSDMRGPDAGKTTITSDASATTADADNANTDAAVDKPQPASCAEIANTPLGGSPAQLVEIASSVRDENEAGVANATVSVINATPPITDTTDAEGNFSLMVPKGATLILQAQSTGAITSQLVYVVPLGDPPNNQSYHTGMDLTALSLATVDDIYEGSGAARDSSRGMASVFLDLPCTDDFNYSDCGGGHTVSSSQAASAFVFGADQMQSGNTTLPGGSPEVFFLNAEPGKSTFTYASETAWLCQTREDVPTQPICPNVFTIIRADCDDE